MKKGTRLYINITNKCNTCCPFCCMYSGPNRNTNMDFETFKHIIDTCEGSFELQLEGGEPLLHPSMYLFMEYARTTKRCGKIIILSNGLIMDKHIQRIVKIAQGYEILIELKLSINYWLIKQEDDFLDRMKMILLDTKDLKYVNVIFNVRKRKQDEDLGQLVEQYGLKEYSNIYYFQSYGRWKDSEYEKPVIVQNISNWRIYASDGTCFEQDLIARSEYENTLE